MQKKQKPKAFVTKRSFLLYLFPIHEKVGRTNLATIRQ